ncbi:MAG: CocE/NonD family hydrolase [Actinomycetota bacterium]
MSLAPSAGNGRLPETDAYVSGNGSTRSRSRARTAKRPPVLRAVVAIYASDDRYTDDVHYTGGALKLLDLVDYPLYMVAMNALPPVPAIAGPRWRERWRGRVEDLEAWLLRWLEEQADGPYWRQGSLRPAYERIGCPTMLVAGWADGYRNATFRVMERLQVPSRLLFGPWSHMAADSSRPGPRIDLVPEMVRWWDRWLRGHRNGVDEGPPVTVYVRHSTRPAPDLDEQPGGWRDDPAWPPDRAATHTLPLSEAAPAGGGTDRLEVRAEVGSAAWISCAGHLPFGQPDDQREDDAWSLTYDWGVEEELGLLGHPRLVVRVGASAPVAFLSAKLCDVLPDGTSTLVARGFLNLTRRRSLTEPEPMRPGVVEEVELELDATSWVFPAGHRLRLSLAGADWPNLVPPPAPVTLTVERDGSALTLPVLHDPSPSPPPSLPPPRPPHPAAEGPGPGRPDPPPAVVWRVVRDVLGRRAEAEIDHGGRTELPDGAVLVERYRGTVGTTRDPGLTWARGVADYRVEWPEATVATSARLDLRGDADAFEVQLDLEAREGDQVHWTRSWHRRIPRHLA